MRVYSGSLGDLYSDLAGDEAILQESEEHDSGGALRFWELDHLAVVLGASGRTAADVHCEACKADDVPLGRRTSGGGTVLVGPGVLCIAVVLPIRLDPALATVESTQTWVLERTAWALHDAVPGLEVRGSGDLTLDGRKCTGSAQRRLRSHVLVHFSILYGLPLELLPRYLAEPSRRPAYRGQRAHVEFLTNLALGRAEIESRLEKAWSHADGHPREPGLVPRGRVQRLVEERLGQAAWIHRF
jgi:lipoate-protein ligase A